MSDFGQLGHYEIVGKLGVGGMGRVYRALDTRLGRHVAIKVLASELRETDALRRFEQEARLLASLNHPNVATLFSFEDAGEERFLVMELVEGRPLSDHLANGPMAVDVSLQLAAEMTAALQAAHERDIIHRDLKPANVMVLPSGTPKLLDFGIATLLGAGASSADQRITDTHQIIGTPAYMSPEQIRGHDVDARTDIWAFGCVLYEMLAGRRLFALETSADTMAAILERDADLTQLPAEVPGAVVAMLQRCVQRDLNRRARDVWHLRQDLEDAVRAPRRAAATQACPSCGENNDPGHRFCGRCGAELAARCPGCSAPLTPGAAFCGACGRQLNAAAAPLSVAVTAVAVREPVATAIGEAPPATTPSALSAGERRYATLVHLVLDGYADLLERHTPEELDGLLGAVEEVVRAEALHHEGTVLSVVDASATLVFGVPVSREDDAERAVAAARAIMALLEQGGDGRPSLEARTGLSSGPCVVRVESEGGYSVAGDAARAASRLADQAGAGDVLIAPGTARLVRRAYATEAEQPLTLPGSRERVTPHRVVGQQAGRGELAAQRESVATAFVGRSSELAELEQALHAALSGTGRFVTIVGEAGMGKTRLLREFSLRAASQARVLVGRCQSRGQSTPYLPFIDMLRTLLLDAAGAPDDEGVAERLATIDPELSGFLPFYLHLLAVPSERYPLPEQLDDRHLSTRIHQALAAIVSQFSAAEPLVLLLEDWHWADEASRETLRQISALVSGYRALVAVAYRPEYREDWSRLPHHSSVHLTPLRPDAAPEIMRSVLAADSVPPDLAELVHARTGGNPLFIEEVCRTLAEKKSLVVEEGQVVLQGRLEDLQLPETIQALIRSRLDRLPPFDLEVVRVASVIGAEMSLPVLTHVVGAEQRLREALDRLQGAGILRQAKVVPRLIYAFQHALVQDVAYDTLLQHQRKALHGLVAEAIEASYGEQSEDMADALAKHFGEAGAWRRAIHYGDIAAERARSLSQFADSVAMLERMAEWHEELSDEDRDAAVLVDLLLRQERMYETLGRRAAQHEAISRLLDLLGDQEASAHLIEAQIRLGDLYATTGRYEESMDALQPALTAAERLGDDVLLRRVHRSIGFLQWHRGDDVAARSSIERAIEIDDMRDEAAERAHDLTNYAATLRRSGDHERMLALLNEAIDTYERLGLQGRMMEPLHVASTVYRQAGELEKALECLKRSRDIGVGSGNTIHLHWELGNLGGIYLSLGRTGEAIEAFEQAIYWSRRSGFAHGLAMSLRAMGNGLVAMGEPAKALPYLREAVEQFADMHEPANEAAVWEDLASAYSGLGQMADAVAARERVLQHRCAIDAAPAQLEAMLELARTARGYEDSTARRAFADAAELAAELDDREAHGDALNSLGILEWQAGRHDQARQAYEQALESFAAIGDERHQGLILNSLGVVLRELGRLEEARERFERALATNAEVGERLLEAHSLAGLGDVAVLADEPGEAIPRYEASLRLREAIDDRSGAAWMLLKLAESSLASGDPDAAVDYASRAREASVETPDPAFAERLRRFDRLPGHP